MRQYEDDETRARHSKKESIMGQIIIIIMTLTPLFDPFCFIWCLGLCLYGVSNIMIQSEHSISTDLTNESAGL